MLLCLSVPPVVCKVKCGPEHRSNRNFMYHSGTWRVSLNTPLTMWRVALPKAPQAKGSHAFRRNKADVPHWRLLAVTANGPQGSESGKWEAVNPRKDKKNCWVKDWGEDDGNSTRPSVTLRMSLANHTFCSTLASRLINFNWLGMTCPPDLEVECSTPTSSW